MIIFVEEQQTVSKGIVERRFDVQREDRVVPGMVWTPEGAMGPRPLVLIGHGASATKREVYVVALARHLVRHFQFAAAAIDGPIHGDRRKTPSDDPNLMFMEFGQIWGQDPSLTDDMVADWRSVIDTLQKLPEVGDGPVGYWGLSMGTIFGLPLVAAEPRISVSVLGLMGVAGPTKARIREDAADIRCPVLFLVQWDDELFERNKAFELFDLLGTKDKRLHANPGSHGAVPADEFMHTVEFLAQHLKAALPS